MDEKVKMRLLTTKQAAVYLNIPEHTLEKREAHGPRYIRFGRAIRYDILDLDEWIDERRQATKMRSAA